MTTHKINAGTSNIITWHVDAANNEFETSIYAGEWFTTPPEVDFHPDDTPKNLDVFALALRLANTGHGRAAHELLSACYAGSDDDGNNLKWSIYDDSSAKVIES
jgi:hypothetical protein